MIGRFHDCPSCESANKRRCAIGGRWCCAADNNKNVCGRAGGGPGETGVSVYLDIVDESLCAHANAQT
ncbi:hypothetical protein WH47_05503 [Habropoda laboriosa]|uniref:Uncharacterized protein n=1 Tax=Habropoda laboriosa TaxID=597456 RepID=A0A0L7RFD6_9HYME|nr:hypothetical protein WH47_05503 [Habropoda laboriosa]